MKVSVVSPVYGSPQSLPELLSRLKETMLELTEDYEILLVNDGCPKGSWEVIKQLSLEYPTVKGINLSRNFGQHYAISAGLELAAGELIVVMDCDLQDRPEEIPKLIKQLSKGYDFVVASRVERADSALKRLSSYWFHKCLTYMTRVESDHSVANFGVYSRKVIDAYLSVSEQIRSFPLHIRWLGFSSSNVEVSHNLRHSGESSYTLSKQLNLALDIVVSFSDRPMKLIVKFGLLVSLVSMFIAFCYVVRWLLYGSSVVGWTSLMVSFWFLSGILIMMLGVVGLYVAKTLQEAKGRPIYIIDEIVGQ